MRNCILCGELLHKDEDSICKLCDPHRILNYRGVTKAGKTKENYKKIRKERNSEVSNDY